LQGHEFNPGACFQSAQGRMYFGGKNGFNSFFPEEIKANPFVPPVIWTAFYRHNEKTSLDQPLSSLQSLTLSYQLSFITFEFAALHYANPKMNQFAYKLEDRDTDWNYLGPNNAISFSNLDPGEYTLWVKAANPDGVWNEEGLSIQLKIVPPFWNTAVFILGALILFSSLAISYFRMRKKSKTFRLAYEKNLERIFDRYKITPREQEIIHLILEGASNKDIEKKLFISNSTVRNHIYNIYQKLDVQNRLGLINLIRKSN
jgi:DNA-binding CsgD family transcriptional regulator